MKFSFKALALLAGLSIAGTQAVAAPAPPLTSVRVYQVSSSAGVEYPSQNQFSTTLDHTAVNGRVVVREIGYGQNRIAKMAGNVLPSSKNISSRALCGSASNPTSCSPGQTVIGWDETWDISGYASGQFTYQATSINSPFNTISTFINIR